MGGTNWDGELPAHPPMGIPVSHLVSRMGEGRGLGMGLGLRRMAARLVSRGEGAGEGWAWECGGGGWSQGGCPEVHTTGATGARRPI